MKMDTDKEAATDTERKVPEAWHEDSDTRSDLKTLLRPMLIVMTVIGCYNFENLQRDGSMTESSRKRWQRLSAIYKFTLFSIILFYIAKGIAGLFYIERSQLEYNVNFLTWQFLCLVWYILFWRASSEKFGTLNTALKTWDKTILPQFIELNIEFPDKQVIKIRNAFIVIGILLLLFNLIGLIVQIVLSGIGPYTNPLPANGLTITVIMICYTHSSAIWLFPDMYVAIVAYTLKQAFRSLRMTMSKSFRTQSCKMPPNFQKLRILHMDLCTLVSEFDADFEWYYATLFIWHVGLACFNLYQILRTEADTITMVLFVFWAVSCLAILGFASSFAAMVNQEAHAPLDRIYYINVSDVDLEKLAQINLFLSKLTGTQVGFSTCGLLIITKEFILTIAGVFLTYFAVLYTL